MKNVRRAERYLRFVLIANGIGDIVLGALMLFLPRLLARSLGLRLSDDLVYVTGGWGTAAFSFGALRLSAGLIANADVSWFAGAFGIFEGITLTAFGLVIPVMTSLTFGQVWLSTLFAAAFAFAYGIAFLWRKVSTFRQGIEGRT